ncbi:MAG: hypothetical protein ACXVX8_08185 [Blastococcus sp.]
MAVRSVRREARREWARRETPELILGIRRRFIATLANSGGATGRARYEHAVEAVVAEVTVEILRHTGNLDLALHAGERTKDICQETVRALQRS